MSAAAQQGYALPEVLAAMALVTLMLATVGESLLPRLELAQAGADRAERERLAARMKRSWLSRRGSSLSSRKRYGSPSSVAGTCAPGSAWRS